MFELFDIWDLDQPVDAGAGEQKNNNNFQYLLQRRHHNVIALFQEYV